MRSWPSKTIILLLIIIFVTDNYFFFYRYLPHWSFAPEEARPRYVIEQSLVAPVPLLQCLSTSGVKGSKAHRLFHILRVYGGRLQR